MKRNITLKHIARELDVSISTVSKALKNSDEIGVETRKKIQAFAKLYNYRPNRVALSLKNRRTHTIGVIIPDIVHHFFTTVFRGIEQVANEKGYKVIVCVSDESFDREVLNIETLTNGSIDGFIMALSAETQLRDNYDHIKKVVARGTPVVLFDRVTDQIVCDKVVNNDKEAACTAVERLIKSGRRRIGLVTTERFLNVSEQREEGYYKALRDHGIPIRKDWVLRLPYRYDSEELSIPYFASLRLDAALCVNEIFAHRSMRILQDMGLRIPQDVALIGFTDGILSRLSTPTLSVVAQHGEEMGAQAAAMLIEKLEDPSLVSCRTEIIPATLIERESTTKLKSLHI